MIHVPSTLLYLLFYSEVHVQVAHIVSSLLVALDNFDLKPITPFEPQTLPFIVHRGHLGSSNFGSFAIRVAPSEPNHWTATMYKCP